MSNKMLNDPRIDPRIKAIMAEMTMAPQTNVNSREELLLQANTEESLAAAEQMRQALEMCDLEVIVPSAGLTVRTETFVSAPDGTLLIFNLFALTTMMCCPACITSTAVACRPCLVITVTTVPLAR